MPQKPAGFSLCQINHCSVLYAAISRDAEYALSMSAAGRIQNFSGFKIIQAFFLESKKICSCDLWQAQGLRS